jgi:ADP-ribosylation factor GTPase-activating protein 2/3
MRQGVTAKIWKDWGWDSRSWVSEPCRLEHLLLPDLGIQVDISRLAVADWLYCSSSTRVDDAPTTAREKFGNQKAISSDMYFGRNDFDPHAVNEAQSRLRDFQGATSISSNQYFGREEEEELHAGGSSTEGGLLGDGSLAGLEVATRDAIQRVLSNPDVQNVGESIRTGALKVRTRSH